MTRRALAILLAAGTLIGCGSPAPQGGPTQDGATYGRDVAAVSTQTRQELSQLADRADYATAASAAASTRAYAGAIRAAASRLDALAPPDAAVAYQRQLVSLYRESAGRLDELARDFGGTTSADERADVSQRLADEVQSLAARERELRQGIERALPTPTP